jgi:mannose-6-phosphate isomerase-like protein (cupin superfamily)
MPNDTPVRPNPEAQARYHLDAEAGIEQFAYAKPESNRPKDMTFLARTKLLMVAIQTVRDGGENNLHYHKNGDQCYFVLSGRVRFHGPDDLIYGEFGPREGIVIPAGSRYWFEKVGAEDLEILQSFGIDKSTPAADRIEIEPNKSWMTQEFMSYQPKS